MAKTCAGLRVRRDTLEPVRKRDLIEGFGPFDTSAYERSAPYIEEFKGSIEVEILPECSLSGALQEDLARVLADDELPVGLEVCEWRLTREPGLIRLTPKSWQEVDHVTGFAKHSPHAGACDLPVSGVPVAPVNSSSTFPGDEAGREGERGEVLR